MCGFMLLNLQENQWDDGCYSTHNAAVRSTSRPITGSGGKQQCVEIEQVAQTKWTPCLNFC